MPSPPSPLRPDVMRQVERLAARHFPGAVVIPSMALGASDGLYLRNAGIPNYALSALAAAEGETNAHGLDEKIIVFKYKAKVRYRRKTGHRQKLSRLLVRDIVTG